MTKFLNWSLFVPLSRLTYSTYIVHVSVLYWHLGVKEHYYHYSEVWLAYQFSGAKHFVLSGLPCPRERLRTSLVTPLYLDVCIARKNSIFFGYTNV